MLKTIQMIKKIIYILMILIFFQFNVKACSCKEANLKESINNSDYIFKAKIISIDTLIDYYLFLKILNISYECTNIYKQKNDNLRPLITCPSESCCGYNFDIGKEYIIYANTSSKIINLDKYIETTICHRTRLYSIFESIQIQVQQLITKINSFFS